MIANYALIEIIGFGASIVSVSSFLVPLYPECCIFMADEALKAGLAAGCEDTLRLDLNRKASQLSCH